MDIFLCEGDAVALGHMIDRALNVPAAHNYRRPDRLHFELASTVVGFACIDVRALRSKPGPGQLVKPLDTLPGVTGVYAHQTEVAVMIQVQDQAGLPYWYLPYVLNGLPTAVTTGREIYGYPKQHAEFAADGMAPGNGAGPGPLFGPKQRWQRSATVYAYDLKLPSQKPGTEREAEFALTEVLEFRHGEPGTASRSAAAGGTASRTEAPRAPDPAVRPADIDIFPGGPVEDVASAITGKAARPSTPGAAPASVSADASEDPGTAFLGRVRSDVPYVFLRQFRDPERESLASYQSMVIGRLVPDSADDLQEQPPDEFSLVLPWTFNLALAQELFGLDPGIGNTVTRPVVGLLSGENATFDVLRATILWQSCGDDRADDRAWREFVRTREHYLQALSLYVGGVPSKDGDR